MKYQTLFSGKNKKKLLKMLSAVVFSSMLSINSAHGRFLGQVYEFDNAEGS